MADEEGRWLPLLEHSCDNHMKFSPVIAACAFDPLFSLGKAVMSRPPKETKTKDPENGD
jgi:hypothetical protein